MRNDDSNLEWTVTDDGRRVQIVKDGGRLRTPMFAKDAVQSSVAAAEPLRITDGNGSADGLHRPGWRIGKGGSLDDVLRRDSQRELIEEARAQYLLDLTSAYKGNPPKGGHQRG